MANSMIDMTKGKPLPLILKFSLPVLLGNLFQQLYTVVDGIVVGKQVGTEALAAVGAGFPITYMIISIFIGLGLGASVLVSQYFGSKNIASIKKVVDTMNSFMFIISIPLTLLGIFSADFFLKLLNVPADILEPAKIYMMIYYLGLLPQFGYNVNSGVLQGMGDSKTPLYILIASSVLHIILAYFLVYIIPLGVAGVAWSTVISQLFSWILSIYAINKKYPEIRIRPKFYFDKQSFLDTLKVGLPIGFQNALFSIGMMVMQPLINSYGTVFIAGYNASNKVDGFVYMPVMSLATAITTYVGQNVGAKDYERVRQGMKSALILVVGLCIVLCAIVIPLRTPLMYIFTDSQEVVDAGNAYLVRVIPLYIVSALQYMYIGILRGWGQSFVPTLATLISLWVARVPSAYLLSHYFGGNNMHWCYPIGWAFGLAILMVYYYFGKWRKRGMAL